MRIVGNGGHAVVIREVIRAVWGCGAPAWGALKEGIFIAVGDNAARRREVLKLRGGVHLRLIHPRATVSPSAEVGVGTVIMAGAVVQAQAKIGDFCIINTGATVDHHCVVGDYAHIAPGAHLCGNVVVGEGALVGVGVGIEPGVRIPAWSIVKRQAYTVVRRCPTK